MKYLSKCKNNTNNIDDMWADITTKGDKA